MINKDKVAFITKEELDKSSPPPKEFIEKCKRAGELINKEKNNVMIMIKYTERYSQDSPDKRVFYTYKEFFQFWKKNHLNGRIELVSHSEMEENN